ncbi:MAG: SusC/RagA family TonB-linked outer membrane protein [Prevotellaceae bacterium]|nr:SusC/RagA family TonB-linked outer membrane protein [Prevotellaceae bacterium]
MKRSKLLAMLLMLMVSMAIHAQNVVVNGNVKDATGEPIIGASVVLVGNTGVGTVTDIDGNFQFSVPQGSQLQISYIGYETLTMKAGSNMNIILRDDSQTLNDVVVIGYGVQKKSVVTAAIAKVSAEDLAGKTPVRVDNALKGLAAGVNVTSNSGQPGDGGRVRIRGNGTINNSDPLYIVDGMPIEGGIDFVSPSDIESIEVLKDAASGAIYGARAANGVVLVTTKKGKEGAASISYNGSYGWQTAWKHRAVTSATDYAVLQNERRINGGLAPLYSDPYNLKYAAGGGAINGFGTDWQSLVFNDNAPVVNHDVSISGASEKLNYYLSANYFSQDGIVGGNYGHSNYDRLTLRSNNMYNVLDATSERSFLNKLDVTVNLAYTNVKNTGVTTNSEFGSILGSALYLSPILPVTITDPTQADMYWKTYESEYKYDNNYNLVYDEMGNPVKKGTTVYQPAKDENGNYYTIPSRYGSYGEMNNPLGMLAKNPTKNWSHKFVPKLSLDLQLWDNLKYHFTYSADMSFWGYDANNIYKSYLSGNNKDEHTSVESGTNKGLNWQIENTLTYDKQFGKHTIGVVLGQSAMKNKSDYLGVNRWNIVNPEKPNLNYTNSEVIWKLNDDGTLAGNPQAEFNGWGGLNVEHRLSSLFGRVSYNYDEKYMLQATLRRDGSSRFGINNKYGVFPSASIGWNIMNEKFMDSTHDWLSNLKFRASWGKNGSDAIGDFKYTVMTTMGSNVLFGKSPQKYVGSKASTTANPDLRWEESEQTDLGFDFGFFNQALTFTVDYFIKKTNGMIIDMPVPSYLGENKPAGNVGDMENKGSEFELGYKGHIGDFRYSFKGNASYIKNTLKNLGNSAGFVEYDGVQGISGGNVSRGENGMPFPFYYGYKTDGIFQNMEEVHNYTNSEGGMIQPNALPGYVRFVDVNGDGQITPDDRTKIGKGTPDWNFGFTVNAEWKGFDFNMFWQGVAGADVFDATYRSDVAAGNFPSWMLGRWTGEGTSNKYPILKDGDSENWVVSDLYVYDGSYLRLKNISLGYTFPRKWTMKAGIERFRIYGMAENLFTFTKYHGFDPEISSNGKSLGIDRGIYPQARTITVGVNVTLSSGKGGKKAKDVTYSAPKVEYVDRVVEKPVEKVVTKEVETTKAVEKTYVATFAVNSAKIADATELNGIEKGATVDVVAYASPEGKAEANKALSQKRADAVAEYLKSRGVNVNRVEAKGANTDHANRIAIVTVK